MPFQIIRNDITKVQAEAIVNTANPDPTYAAGVDQAIYKAAGEKMLLSERKKIGSMEPGEVAVTPAYKLQAKYIIHVVGPTWMDGKQGEINLLKTCYEKVLKKAQALKCKSIAFPVISSGVYGFPKDIALQVATTALQEFSMHHRMEIYLVVFDRETYDLSSNVFKDIETYVDENYVDDANAKNYQRRLREIKILSERRIQRRKAAEWESQSSGEVDFESSDFNDKLISDDDKTFQEKFFEYLDQSGMTDAEFYKSLEVSRQWFSKIRSDKYYKPQRKTAIMFCVGLKLDETQTNDLLMRAGFALMPNEKFDLIVKACIHHKMYNIQEINDYLEKQKLPTLTERKGDKK